jgi:hypothetical protein
MHMRSELVVPNFGQIAAFFGGTNSLIEAIQRLQTLLYAA